MFEIGQYRVEFKHRCDHDSVVLIHRLKNPEIKALTYCMIKHSDTRECVSSTKILVENGGSLSKNKRRKDSMAKCLQELFPSNGNHWNKKARTLFWEKYFNKIKEDQKNALS
jgi:hypothetical protein